MKQNYRGVNITGAGFWKQSKQKAKLWKNPHWGAQRKCWVMFLSKHSLSAFRCSLGAGGQINSVNLAEVGWKAKAGSRRVQGVGAPDPRLGEGFSTCFGELQPTDPSPGCSGRAWPTCEKGRGEFENKPASAKGGRELGSDLLASLPAVCSRWEGRRGRNPCSSCVARDGVAQRSSQCR